MDKKELKLYEAPTSEVMEVKLQGILCTSTVEGLDDPNDITGGNQGMWD